LQQASPTSGRGGGWNFPITSMLTKKAALIVYSIGFYNCLMGVITVLVLRYLKSKNYYFLGEVLVIFKLTILAN